MNGALWLRRPLPGARARLVCLPYAGGAARVFRDWQRLAPDWLEVCPVEYPGHGARMGQVPLDDIDTMVRDVAAELDPLPSLPTVLFGHSMGGLVAYELARWMVESGGPQPVHLFVSASPDPRGERGPANSTLPADELVQSLADMGGTPRAVLESPELMELALPVVRADFAALESYHHGERPLLPVPLTVIGGLDDTLVGLDQLEGWRECATEVTMNHLPGGHFFLHDTHDELLDLVVTTLQPQVM